MKRLIVLLFTGVIFFAGSSSCKKLIKAVFGGTDVTVPDFQVTIPTIYAVTPYEIPIGSYSFYFNLDSNVRASTAGVFGAKDVNSIKVKQIRINFANADSLNNIANFDSARITVQSTSNNNPLELLGVSFPDSYASTYTYTPTNSPELVSYAKGSTITYNVFGIMRRVTTKPLTMVVSVTLRAD